MGCFGDLLISLCVDTSIALLIVGGFADTCIKVFSSAFSLGESRIMEVTLRKRGFLGSVAGFTRSEADPGLAKVRFG
jgi:hypothetical protein